MFKAVLNKIQPKRYDPQPIGDVKRPGVAIFLRGDFDLNDFIEMKSKINGKILDTNYYLDRVELVAVSTRNSNL